ncbi:MAG TPA: hypothetical protein VH985_25775 [Candidatus Binatia bacterium]|jgi:hypothetical protein
MKTSTGNQSQNLLFVFFVPFVLCALASTAWAAAVRTKIVLVVPHRVLFTVALPV